MWQGKHLTAKLERKPQRYHGTRCQRHEEWSWMVHSRRVIDQFKKQDRRKARIVKDYRTAELRFEKFNSTFRSEKVPGAGLKSGDGNGNDDCFIGRTNTRACICDNKFFIKWRKFRHFDIEMCRMGCWRYQQRDRIVCQWSADNRCSRFWKKVKFRQRTPQPFESRGKNRTKKAINKSVNASVEKQFRGNIHKFRIPKSSRWDENIFTGIRTIELNHGGQRNTSERKS